MKLFFHITVFFASSFACVTGLAQDTVFIKSYGNIGYNYGEKIIAVGTNGYIILGNKTGFSGNTDIYLLRVDFSGNYVWDKAIGTSDIESARDIIRTSDGAFVIAGFKNIPANNNDYDILLLKTDTSGNVLWEKTYGGSNWDFGYSVVETPDSGFIVAGETFSFGNGNNDVFILKTDKNGDSLSAAYYGGPGSEVANDIIHANGGNYLVSGYTNGFGHGNFDVYLMKINQNLDTIWTKAIGDTLNDISYCSVEATDYGFVFSGLTENYNALKNDGLVLKVDSSGTQLWAKAYGGPDNDQFNGIDTSSSGGFILAGYTQSYGYAPSKDYYMFVADQNGGFINSTTYGGEREDYANSCIATVDKGFAIIGSTESMGLGLSNMLLVKTDSFANSNPLTYEHITDIAELGKSRINIFPNPSSNIVNIVNPNTDQHIQICLTNELGEVLLMFQCNEKHLQIDLENYPAGLYLLSVISQKNMSTYKIIHSK